MVHRPKRRRLRYHRLRLRHHARPIPYLEHLRKLHLRQSLPRLRLLCIQQPDRLHRHRNNLFRNSNRNICARAGADCCRHDARLLRVVYRAERDGCDTIDSDYGITLAQFIAWNTYVDEACDNIWPDYAYCVDSDVAVT
jgi:hypothetical protein